MSDASSGLVDADRLWGLVEALAAFTDPARPWTRRAFSPLHARSRQWLRERFGLAGMATHVDAGGNLVGRWVAPGADPHAPALVTGSHCDTVPDGGRFDGIIGVLAGIEVVESMRRSGQRLRHPVEVIDFLSEEPSDYGISCVGSRALSGRLPADSLAATAPGGETLATGLRRAGGDPERVGAPLRAAGSVRAFVELHIEQGPVLEAASLPVGVVTDIVGIVRVQIVVNGRPDHAGTTPMGVRRDALVGAALAIAEVETLARAWDGAPHPVVATVGRIGVTPNASNAVPGQVELTMEVRSPDPGVLERFTDALMARVTPLMQARGLGVQVRPVSRSVPTACAPVVMDAIERACATLGLASMRLPSGAGHDAAYVAPLAPVGMIFVPCLNGRSHCPEEWIEPAQLADGARVLYRTLVELDAAFADR